MQPGTQRRFPHERRVEALVGRGYSTPASLGNAAIGGLVTPKLTFSFTG